MSLQFSVKERVKRHPEHLGWAGDRALLAAKLVNLVRFIVGKADVDLLATAIFAHVSSICDPQLYREVTSL